MVLGFAACAPAAVDPISFFPYRVGESFLFEASNKVENVSAQLGMTNEIEKIAATQWAVQLEAINSQELAGILVDTKVNFLGVFVTLNFAQSTDTTKVRTAYCFMPYVPGTRAAQLSGNSFVGLPSQISADALANGLPCRLSLNAKGTPTLLGGTTKLNFEQFKSVQSYAKKAVQAAFENR